MKSYKGEKHKKCDKKRHDGIKPEDRYKGEKKNSPMYEDFKGNPIE
ncbi:hypothetical protein [Clostridium rectalis]|nr:hypothetical protein [Clostridium rectalis]